MPPRTFRCRACRRTQVSDTRWVPHGWYMLRMSAGEGKESVPLGICCSLVCLLRAVPFLGAVPQEARDHIARAVAAFHPNAVRAEVVPQQRSSG
jgi:hypothetical protein